MVSIRRSKRSSVTQFLSTTPLIQKPRNRFSRALLRVKLASLLTTQTFKPLQNKALKKGLSFRDSSAKVQSFTHLTRQRPASLRYRSLYNADSPPAFTFVFSFQVQTRCMSQAFNVSNFSLDFICNTIAKKARNFPSYYLMVWCCEIRNTSFLFTRFWHFISAFIPHKSIRNSTTGFHHRTCENLFR